MTMRRARDDRKQIIEKLTGLVDEIERTLVPEKEGRRRSVQDLLLRQAARLEGAAERLDPVLRPTKFFDPTNPETAGHMVALTSIAQPRHHLASLRRFYGAGVYALYYTGSFDAYERLSGTEQPVYVGKADPKKQSAEDPVAQGMTLFRRLNQHKRSIERASGTLDVEDFECRFLVVQSGYQAAAEQYLTDFFKPIWNRICYGIGKHGDRAETRGNKRSPWDTLHPGRRWALASIEDQKSEQQIRDEIDAHLVTHVPRASLHDVLVAFLEELRQLAPLSFSTIIGREVDVEGNHET